MSDESLQLNSDNDQDKAPWWASLIAPRAFNIDPITGEYLGSSQADPSPLEPGVWLLPAHCFTDAPPAAGQGQAVVRENNAWVVVADHRGATVYSTETGESRTWGQLGALPAGLTLTAPESAYDKWENGQWQLDEAAELASRKEVATRKRALLLQYASSQVNALQDAVDLEIASQAEVQALKAWKTYRVLLNRVDTVGSVPADDAWPASPDPAATTGYLTAQGYEAAPAA